ncbi:MAG: hypothetical protein AB7L90_21005 [Hyphomicrobiaceae bacterium]
MARRARNLGDDDIKKIVEIIDGTGKDLNWEALIKAVELRLGSTYTRQALHKHERIRLAFTSRKKGHAAGEKPERKRTGSIELQKALERIERLTAQNQRLELENNRLLEQYVRWAYNAHTRGLDEQFLNRPLPAVDRGQTKVKS